MGISILVRPFINTCAVDVVMPAVGVLCWSSYASYGLSVFSQIFLSSLNNLHSGFSLTITLILVVITVAEELECLIFFFWREELLWEFSCVGNDTDCMLRHIRNSQLANCFCIRSVVSPSVWFFVKSNSIQSLLCTDVIGLHQGWTSGQPEGL